MIGAHGNTPLHDDPVFWNWIGLFGAGGGLSFLLYWVMHRG